MRKDKAKSIAKVTSEILKNPLSTVREIAETTWVSKSSVANYINEDLDKLGQKDERILKITETDLNIVEKWQKEIDRRLSQKEELEKMKTIEISQVIKENTARYSLFRWSATDDKWGLKQPDVTFQIVNPNLDGEENN